MFLQQSIKETHLTVVLQTVSKWCNILVHRLVKILSWSLSRCRTSAGRPPRKYGRTWTAPGNVNIGHVVTSYLQPYHALNLCVVGSGNTILIKIISCILTPMEHETETRIGIFRQSSIEHWWLMNHYMCQSLKNWRRTEMIYICIYLVAECVVSQQYVSVCSHHSKLGKLSCNKYIIHHRTDIE